MTPKVAIIILAAGSSTRMGHSKQLLDIGGIKLLPHTAGEALKSNAHSVWIVLGNNATQHEEAIAHLNVHVIANSNWAAGMGSSLKIGLQQVITQNKSDAVIISVCDQPLISASIFNQLIEKFKMGAKAVACKYSNVAGVPALFGRDCFDELLHVGDQEGAKKVLAHVQDLKTIDFPGGAHDLDTPEDYDSFIRQSPDP